MSRTADETIEEPETILSAEEWAEAKLIAIHLVGGDDLYRPDGHLTYVRDCIRAALGQDVV